eukprot:9726736-Lingulodinium_polyedra.AAC.1
MTDAETARARGQNARSVHRRASVYSEQEREREQEQEKERCRAIADTSTRSASFVRRVAVLCPPDARRL